MGEAILNTELEKYNWYVLTNELANDEEDAILEGESEYLDRIDIDFELGEELPIDDFLLPIEFSLYHFSVRGEMPDHLSLDDIPGPVISVRAAKFLREAGVRNLQFFPLSIIDPYSNIAEVEIAYFKDEELDYESVTYDQYGIVNFVGLVDCIDLEASELEFFDEDLTLPENCPAAIRTEIENERSLEIDHVAKLVLDESMINPDMQVFRLLNRDDILLFRHDLVKGIEDAELTGFAFCPVEEYSESMPEEDDVDEDESGVKPELALDTKMT